MIDTQTEMNAALQKTGDFIDKMVEAASAEAVFGTPIERGETTIIPCCEVMAGGGMGLGGGPAPAGEGGKTALGWGTGTGGGSSARPIALIVVSPDGVKVEPIVDATKVALAGLTTVGFMLLWLARLNFRRRASFAGFRKAMRTMKH